MRTKKQVITPKVISLEAKVYAYLFNRQERKYLSISDMATHCKASNDEIEQALQELERKRIIKIKSIDQFVVNCSPLPIEDWQL